MRKALLRANNVLRSHGFTNFVPGAGETVVDVSDDFNLEPGVAQWNGSAWVAYVEPQPNVVGFEGALKSVFPIGRRKSIAKEYPWFLFALRDRNWTDAQAYLTDARLTNVISQAEYDAIKAEIADKNLPIPLP